MPADSESKVTKRNTEWADRFISRVTTEAKPVYPEERQIKHELARALGIGDPPSPASIKVAFREGLGTISRLREEGVIDDETSQRLIDAFALLYIGTLVKNVTIDMSGTTKRAPSFLFWLDGVLR